MRNIFTAAFFLFSISLSAQNNEAHFLSNPCLTPDGQTAIFSFEGDLWKADVKTGQASRITAMQGYETSPRVSPDGKWIAFTGRQYGNADVYVMPVGGGDIKQITFHSSGDEVNSWSWDSKYIYFTSNRMGQQSGFKVSANGGTPQRVFGNYFFLYDHNLFEHPTSGEIFFNDTWESSNQVQRKHYKGPFNPDIQSYNIKTKQYKRYTDYIGKDFGATLDKNGNIYFISDEANGEYNLYTFDNGKKTQLTDFNTSIKNAIVNAGGGKVIFEKGYQLYVYDVAAKRSEKLNINITRNDILPKEKDFEVKGNISFFDISPDGKKLVFVSRGEIFVSDAEGKFVEQIKKGSAERASEAKWLSDNKTILFNQTVNGFLNWFTIAADGSAPLKQLTKDEDNDRAIALNRTKTKAVYLSGRDDVKTLDLKTWESKTVVKDEIWAFENSGPCFSPDENYICFTAFRNFEQDIFVHDLKTGKTTDLTNTGITEADPLWSPDGNYIYFESSRLKAAYPFGMQEPKIYRLPLQKFDEPFRTDKYDELFKTEKKDTTIHPVVIDATDIMERIEQVSPNFGSQYLMNIFQKDKKTIVIYRSDHDQGKTSLWKTVIEPFEQNKTEKINGADAGGFDVEGTADKCFALFNGNVYKLNLDGDKVDQVSISNTFRRDLSEEFDQIFYETWAQLDENYYDEKFHGVDWKKTKEYYSKFLPFINTRADLRILLNDMLGELNSSHQGFSTFGADEDLKLANRTMETGIIFEDNDPYKVKYIVKRSAVDKMGIDIQPGDELIKVNDVAIDKSIDRNFYFTRPSLDKELKLTLTHDGKPYDVKLHPEGSLFGNLYDEWIDNNHKRVDERSNNKIAYACMKNMGTGELDQFIIHMTEELNTKQALILDLRYNTGGNVHDEVLKFLSQRSYLQWKYRDGKLTPQPNFSPSDKPIVLLVNEQSLSDAEMTAAGFKALKLGKIIGNETYHWIIFTSGAGLVDGSFVRLPSWGCYTLDGKDIEANGVKPDILVVNTFEDKINGRDPQIDKAVDEILKQLK
ncbi:MAG TPA: S41 family peptidase [Puia sp.]|nr:S41 family peptidase [Puia sp.]